LRWGTEEMKGGWRSSQGEVEVRVGGFKSSRREIPGAEEEYGD
jgi:hypothetical protein